MEIDNFKATLEDLSYDPQKEEAYLITYEDCLECIQGAFLFIIPRKYSEQEKKTLVEKELNKRVSDDIKKLPRRGFAVEDVPEEVIIKIKKMQIIPIN